jgi:hypothetical protein
MDLMMLFNQFYLIAFDFLQRGSKAGYDLVFQAALASSSLGGVDRKLTRRSASNVRQRPALAGSAGLRKPEKYT